MLSISFNVLIALGLDYRFAIKNDFLGFFVNTGRTLASLRSVLMLTYIRFYPFAFPTFIGF